MPAWAAEAGAVNGLATARLDLGLSFTAVDWFSTYRVHHRVAARFREPHINVNALRILRRHGEWATVALSTSLICRDCGASSWKVPGS